MSSYKGGNQHSVDQTDIERFGNKHEMITDEIYKNAEMNFEIAKGRKPNNIMELNSFLEQQRRYSDIKNNAIPMALNMAGAAFSDVLNLNQDDETKLMTGLGAGLGGWALNKATGNPVGKGIKNIRDLFTSYYSSSDTPDSPNNASPNQQNYKTNESKLHNNSFKTMGGLSGEPPTPLENFKTKSINTLTDFADNVKGFVVDNVETAGKFAGKALGVAGVGLNIYEANKGYHDYLNQGYSKGEAFIGGVADAMMPVPTLRSYEMPAPQTNAMPVNGVEGASVFAIQQPIYYCSITNLNTLSK